MRTLALACLLLIGAYLLYRIVARRARSVRNAEITYFSAAAELDITRGEAEQFLDFLAHQQPATKRTKEFFDSAAHELKRRVHTPRSQSRDRRPIETIEPHTSSK